jgi:hypothetical protein
MRAFVGFMCFLFGIAFYTLIMYLTVRFLHFGYDSIIVMFLVILSIDCSRDLTEVIMGPKNNV